VTQDATDLAPYELAFRDAAIGMALLTLDGRWLKVNDAFCELVGHPREQLLELEYTAITHGDDRALDSSQKRALLEGQSKSVRFEQRYLHAAGHPVWVQTCMSLGRDTQTPIFFSVQAEDVGARRRAEAEARAFFENSLDLLAIAELGQGSGAPGAQGSEEPATAEPGSGETGSDETANGETGNAETRSGEPAPTSGRFLRVNPAWEKALGYSAEELTSRPFLDFVYEEDHARTLGAVAELEAGKQVRAFRNRYRAKDGSLRWLDWNTQPEEGGRLFCVARDVTDQVEHDVLRARLEEEIRQAALVDPLTGIYNRRGFFLLAEQALRAAARHQRPYLLCFFDLNGLKEINDELGHDQGDEALYDIAEVFRSVFRSSDILGRLGGDEFVVLAEGEPSAEAALRQRLGDELTRHNETAGRAYRLSTSVGVAIFEPRKPSTLSALLQQADRQMYEQKRVARRSSAPQTGEPEPPLEGEPEPPVEACGSAREQDIEGGS
jgi:diguanylate cyclase (GGDEF)-like protein/PAS domain S-box-containing protein